jgi:UPF0755 protein
VNDLFLEDLGASPEPSHDGAGNQAETGSSNDTRRRRRRTTVVSFIVMIGLFGVLVVAGIVAGPKLIDALRGTPAPDYPGPGSGSVTVEIHEGDTGKDIAVTLVDAGVVASDEAFVNAFNANPGATSIQVGAYDLPQEMKAADAVAALLDPAFRAEVTVTVAEGQRASQVYERISSVTGIPIADVEAAAKDTAAIGLPAEANGNVEGWLAAATYTIRKDATATEILGKMIGQTVAILDERDVPADQRENVLIKASIVEKEVNSPEDYGKVARVIENRLAADSPTDGTLGMDSTLAFALDKSGLDLTREDLESGHPYNTRTHAGLPPGPIGSPGTAAIDAVLDPPEGDWVYFVTVNPDTGETRFTASYEEHLANQALYRQWLAEHGGATEGSGG